MRIAVIIFITHLLFLKSQTKGEKVSHTPSACKEKFETSKTSHPEAIGFWKASAEKAKLEGLAYIEDVFKYDGNYITLQITNTGTATWLSKDGYYKLRTEWRYDSLFYVHPLNKTIFIACFKDTFFLRADIYEGVLKTREYERITEKEVPEYLRPILKKRSVFNYYLTK